MALKNGVQQASPVLLEPVMAVGIVTPSEYTGDVVGDLAAREAQIMSMEPRTDGTQAMKATVPLAEMFGYATELRSMTQGRGTFSMEFDHYAEVSAEVMDRIVSGRTAVKVAISGKTDSAACQQPVSIWAGG